MKAQKKIRKFAKNHKFMLLLCFIMAMIPFGKGSPSDIKEMTAEIQGQSPENIRKIIERRFGKRARDIGSGLCIEQWDIAGGVLTFHPFNGVWYKKDGVNKKLLQTSNQVHECLLNDFQMTTTPNAKGSCIWIGVLTLRATDTYEFVDEKEYLDEGTVQGNNFFTEHLTGEIHIHYSDGVTAESLLEQLPDDKPIAEIEFIPDDGEATETFFIISNKDGTRLEFKAKTELPFQLNNSWLNYWNYHERTDN